LNGERTRAGVPNEGEGESEPLDGVLDADISNAREAEDTEGRECALAIAGACSADPLDRDLKCERE